MRNYFAVIILALIIAPAAHGAPPNLVGQSICGNYRTEMGSQPGQTKCETVLATDTIVQRTSNFNGARVRSTGAYTQNFAIDCNNSFGGPTGVCDFVQAVLTDLTVQRFAPYGKNPWITMSSAASYVTFPDGSAQTYIYSVTPNMEYISAFNRTWCPNTDKRQSDGALIAVPGTGHPDLWTHLDDMKALCNVLPDAQTDAGSGSSTKPAAIAPVAKPEAAESCAPAQVKRLKVTIKQVGGACASARALMVGYVKTHKDPSGYVCVDLKSTHQVVAKCKSTHRAKRATLITGTYRR